MSRMAHPSIVDSLYALEGTPARPRRARRATTPALVCDSTRIGFPLACRVSAKAIRWVFPHPAGAVTVPHSIANRSMSFRSIAGPRKGIVDERTQPWVRVRQVRADDVAGNVLHPCHLLEPTVPPCPGGLAEKLPTVGCHI